MQSPTLALLPTPLGPSLFDSPPRFRPSLFNSPPGFDSRPPFAPSLFDSPPRFDSRSSSVTSLFDSPPSPPSLPSPIKPIQTKGQYTRLDINWTRQKVRTEADFYRNGMHRPQTSDVNPFNKLIGDPLVPIFVEGNKHCNYCQRNREPAFIFRSHNIRNFPNGPVVCPFLARHVCEICHQPGHTKCYCSVVREHNANVIDPADKIISRRDQLAKTSTLADGSRRHRSGQRKMQ